MHVNGESDLIIMIEIIKGFIFFSILIYASSCDMKTREVPNHVHIMILITAFIGISPQKLLGMCLGALLVPLPLLVSTLITPDSIGGADIKIMAACAFVLGFERGLAALILGLAVGVVATVIINGKPKGKFPMVPYLTVGSIAVFFV